MERTETLPDLLRRLWRGEETRPLVCIMASIATGAFISGLAVAGGWAYGTISRAPLRLPGSFGEVRDEEIGYAMIGAVIVWLAVLAWIWRPVLRLRGDLRGAGVRRDILKLVGMTVVIAGAVTWASIYMDTSWRRLERADIAITALCLLAGSVVILLWMPMFDRCVYGEVRRQAAARVSCARCGYSMIGLRESLCPECGQQYTLDELYAAQEGMATKQEG